MLQSLFNQPPQVPPSMGRPLIIDSFAGGGGASTGIEMALGRSPDIAINHNAAALALHAANHPKTLHISENIYKVDPLDYVAGQHIGLAWFSPDCKHFSKAKGGKPVERNIRDLAHIIPFWVERLQKSGGRIDVIIMENVEEFSTWGPLIETEKGLMPDPARRGETFQKWCKRLRQLGGRLEKRELRARDYGAPTIRKRLFVIIRFDGRKIVWPEQTHGAPDDADVIAGRKLPWRTAAECIDWSLPCPSIFDNSEEIFAKHGLRSVRPLADNTMARVARGMKRYVLDAERPFLVQTGYGERAGQAPRAMSVEDPLGTIVAGGVKHAVVAPHIASYYSHTGKRSERTSEMDEPLATIVTENRHAVIAPHLMTMRNAQKPFNGIDEPTHTITAGGAGLSMVAPHLMSLKGSARRDSGAEQPHPTILAGGNHSAVIAPVITHAQHGGANRRVDEPHHTITASKKDQNSVIVPTLVGCGGRAGQSRPRGGDEPMHTMTAKADTCVATAFIAQHNGDPRVDGSEVARPGRGAVEPLATITQSGSQQSVISAFVAQHTAGSHPGRPAKDAREPLSTITGTGSQQGVVSAFLHAYYGVDQDTPLTEPLHTATTKPRFAHIESELSIPPFTADQVARARQVADFLRAHGFWDEREIVTIDIDGETFVIVDIGMRMLTPRELYNAQGFPADYVIDGVWAEPQGGGERMWIPFSKSVQVSCVGNSVSPPVARALVGANCHHLAEERMAA